MSQKFPTKPHRSFSELQTIRKNSKNELPTVLQNLKALSIEDNEALGAAADHDHRVVLVCLTDAADCRGLTAS